LMGQLPPSDTLIFGRRDLLIARSIFGLVRQIIILLMLLHVFRA